MTKESKKLYRSKTDKIIAGVCGGLAEYFAIEPIIVRLIFVALIFTPGASAFIIYIILAIVIPEEPGPEVEINRKEKAKEFGEKVAEGAEKFAKEAKSLAEDFDHKGFFQDSRNIFALIIIAFGALALLNQFMPIHFMWNSFWPVVVILFGVYLMLKKD